MVSTKAVRTNSSILMVSKTLISTKSIHNEHNEYKILIASKNRVDTNSTPQM
jgi:hypothetical protein